MAGISVDAALSRLREIAASFPRDSRPRFAKGATPARVDALESARGPLPPAVRTFLVACDQVVAMDVWNGYWIGGTRGISRMLAREDVPKTVVLRGAKMPVCPVATDGGGNTFLVVLDGPPIILKRNHETGELEQVADDFESFLERVAEDWRHAALEDGAWSYLSG
jgi:hypothetical protein